ncbi:MAG: NAD(P)-dependent glycerol-3-phosphate dehydrogenase [Candidatus Omnitrophica bacterium]|nr:NAD(P)-dependent glycerol-3-phosphate dehydrogenase [Candidatus Omnitrophota bacterium]
MGTQIGVIGAGGWGTCLSLLALKRNHTVRLWEVFPDYAWTLQERRENILFLPGIRIPPEIMVSASLPEVVRASKYLLIAVPSRYFRHTLQRLKPLYRNQPLLIATKGLEVQTGMTMSAVLKQLLPDSSFAVLSGPCIARELACGCPSAAVVASPDLKIASIFQKHLSSSSLRLYTTVDVRGVELGGAIKNVIAIGAGIIDGLNLGINTKAAYLTRGLKEMVRVGVALGGKEKTFYGLSGLGDLITTAFSPVSRNRSFGEALITSSQEKFFQETQMVVEGYFTVKSLLRLIRARSIDAPITQAIYRIVYLKHNPRQVLEDLMNRRLKQE